MHDHLAEAKLEKLAQYILRNPFSVAKMTMESPTDTVIYRSKLNRKIIEAAINCSS